MGQTKASLRFGSQTLLTRVVDRISEAVSSVVVVAALDQEVDLLPKTAKLVRDDERGRGPLAGLAAGLAALADHCDAAYVSSCDSPFVSPLVIRRLFELLGADAICVPYVDGRLHPLAAVYRVDLLPLVRSQLALSRLRLTDLVNAAPTRLVGENELRDIDLEFMSLRNINTPGEYQQALADAGFA